MGGRERKREGGREVSLTRRAHGSKALQSLRIA